MQWNFGPQKTHRLPTLMGEINGFMIFLPQQLKLGCHQNGRFWGMGSMSARTNFLDASALVMMVVQESRSKKLQTYLAAESNWHTTPISFFEALNVLKRKRGKELSEKDYHKAAFDLLALFRGKQAKIENLWTLDITDPMTFNETQKVCQNHGLDLSDAFQILSVKAGTFSGLVGDSKTVLITDDKNLSKAATKEGLKVWLLKDPPPD
jgi:predicted nucleic acid-binding protein